SDTALDVARIRHLKANEAEGETIFYDLNRSWLPAEAIAVMNQVQGLDVFFEQPCETYDECLHVRRQTSHPISLDEGLKAFSDLLRMQRDGAAEIAHIKIGRVGGLTKAKLMRDFCLATGVKVLIMETGGSVMADTAAAHLIQATPERSRIATWDCAAMLSVVSAEGAVGENGRISAPAAPGLGATPIMEVLGDPVAVYE
ncbi:MAG: enolase C-terminal domain-like protein, partial [Hyphomicrobiales bacterium]